MLRKDWVGETQPQFPRAALAIGPSYQVSTPFPPHPKSHLSGPHDNYGAW